MIIMAKKNYYAVRCGKETGIFTSWDACKASVSGYPGAEYKGFVTMEEAQEYLGGRAEHERLNPSETVVAYVDGSYEHGIRRYSYGCILLLPSGEQVRRSDSGNDPALVEYRNVTGEVMGAMCAVNWCEEHGYASLEICHDYEGIAKWALGEWKRNNDLTRQYAEFMQNAMKHMKIKFRKIAAHTGDTYNEEADQLAKEALGIGES